VNFGDCRWTYGDPESRKPFMRTRLLFALISRCRWKPAARVTLMVLAGAAAGCAGQSAEPRPIELRFPDASLTCAGFDNCRHAARTAARVYVKVVILAPAPAHGGRVDRANQRVVSGASGIIVGPAGYVVTAAHIARSTALEARVITIDGREHSARVVDVDADRELALLKIDDEKSRFATVASAPGVRRGQPVFAIGTPGNRPGAVTVGYVDQPRLERRVGYGEYGYQGPMRLALQVEPGHSGGPVFDTEGSLVGMVFAFDLKNNSGDYFNTGTAYAVPARDLKAYYRDRATPFGNF
jgi:S1-C subfamily serine protease